MREGEREREREKERERNNVHRRWKVNDTRVKQ